MGDICAGCSLVVTMVRVYQFDSIAFNITDYFCTPQKASVGMYSRCDYLLFVYFLILPSLLHSSILFNCFYTCFCSFFIALSSDLFRGGGGGPGDIPPPLTAISPPP